MCNCIYTHFLSEETLDSPRRVVLFMSYSEDGKWFFDGEKWIPSPPTQQPSQPVVNMQDSVIAGDLNYNPQVINNVNNIFQNPASRIENPTEDLSLVSDGAFLCGKKALFSIGILVAFLAIGLLISSFFDVTDPDRISQDGTEWQNDDGVYVSIEDKPFDRLDYIRIFAPIGGLAWIVVGVYIFATAGPINTFNRVREQYPSSPTLEQGDKGKTMHDVAKYSWLVPLVLVIIFVIIAIIFFKIAAEMQKNNR